jgi:hypothetical protein
LPTEPPSPPDDPPRAPSIDADDVRSIDAIIRALYDSVSFAEGGGPNEARLRGLVDPSCRLIKVLADGRHLNGDLEGYLTQVRSHLGSGLRSFVERELLRRTEVYGGIAHVFTTYEAEIVSAAGERVVRGINSVQLRNDGQRWWLLSIFWTDEEEGSPIPTAYLPRP